MDYQSFRNLAQAKLLRHQNEIRQELTAATMYKPVKKDILIVVKDQLLHIKNCIESIYKNTEDFKLYVWDNGSKKETADYLNSIKESNYHLTRVEENEGFIIPNNRLAKQGKSPFVILLNSDTVVHPRWDHAMIGWIQNQGDTVVGYMGSKLDDQGKGGQVAYGRDADYICGWCMCMPRQVCELHGLFDEVNLQFAYGEDSDFCFRVIEAGGSIYSLHVDLVIHFENKTSSQLRIEGCDFSGPFEANHEYIRSRWSHFIKPSGSP